MLNPEEEQATEDLGQITKLALKPVIWVVVFTLPIVSGSAFHAMQAWSYSLLECLVVTVFSAVMGIAIFSALKAKYWIGFSHIAAFAYLLALLCTIPFLQTSLSGLQVVLFLSSIQFASAAYSLHRKDSNEDKA